LFDRSKPTAGCSANGRKRRRYNVISLKGMVRLNVDRTHNRTDTSSCSRVIDTPVLCSGGSELRPRPRWQVS